MVAVAGDLRASEILERRRVTLVDPEERGAVQPYHFAANLDLAKAQAHLDRCAAAARRLAVEELRAVVTALGARGFEVAGCGILLASGRPLPPLAEILAAHPLIHTAEGEFFRNALREAAQHLRMPATGIRERELFPSAVKGLRTPLASIRRRLAQAGKPLGPPWTADQKNSALAGWLVLAAGRSGAR